MTLETNAFTSYLSVGNREDLSDVIYRISPTDTPFLSGIDKEKASGVYHEWQTQALASASSSNAHLEGDGESAVAATATVRLGNYCQISKKLPRVTGTEIVIDKAGRGNEMAYQEMLKGLELKTDIESALLASTTAQNAGNGTTIRRAGPCHSYIATNVDVTSTSSNNGNGTTVSTPNDTTRAFTEAQLKGVLSAIWTQGGKPDVVMTGAFNKQQFSTFTGRASVTEDAKGKKITASVTAYESDFGTLKVVANRFQRARDVFVFQMDMWAIAYLNGRRMVSEELGKTGDSVMKHIISEYTLVARNEKSSGWVADLTTA
ncbi:MAG TPA: DUF5309 domain-containing protein [Candidatus Paceibacterota bacterium]